MKHENCGEYVFLTNGTAVCEDCGHVIYTDDLLEYIPDVPTLRVLEAC